MKKSLLIVIFIVLVTTMAFTRVLAPVNVYGYRLDSESLSRVYFEKAVTEVEAQNGILVAGFEDGTIRVYQIDENLDIEPLGEYAASFPVTAIAIKNRNEYYVSDIMRNLYHLEFTGSRLLELRQRMAVREAISQLIYDNDTLFALHPNLGFSVYDSRETLKFQSAITDLSDAYSFFKGKGSQRLWVARGLKGFTFFDVSNPRNPLRLLTEDTPGFAEKISVKNGKVWVADGFGGLLVFDEQYITREGLIGFEGWTNELFWEGDALWVSVLNNGIYQVDQDDRTVNKRFDITNCSQIIKYYPAFSPDVSIQAGVFNPFSKRQLISVALKEPLEGLRFIVDYKNVEGVWRTAFPESKTASFDLSSFFDPSEPFTDPIFGNNVDLKLTIVDKEGNRAYRYISVTVMPKDEALMEHIEDLLEDGNTEEAAPYVAALEKEVEKQTVPAPETLLKIISYLESVGKFEGIPSKIGEFLARIPDLRLLKRLSTELIPSNDPIADIEKAKYIIKIVEGILGSDRLQPLGRSEASFLLARAYYLLGSSRDAGKEESWKKALEYVENAFGQLPAGENAPAEFSSLKARILGDLASFDPAFFEKAKDFIREALESFPDDDETLFIATILLVGDPEFVPPVDEEEPSITFYSPQFYDDTPAFGAIPVHETRSSKIKIAVTIMDDRGLSKITAGNVEVGTIGRFDWKYNLFNEFELPSLVNEFSVEAFDMSGNRSETHYTIISDKQPPVISFDRNKYYSNRPRFEISGTVRDNYWLKEINGVEASGKDQRFLFIQEDNQNGLFQVIGKDRLGHEACATTTYIYDTEPPEISFGAFPDRVKTTVSSLPVSFSLQDNEALESLSVGAQRVTLGERRAYGVDIPLSLSEGWNAYEALLKDMAGNLATANIRIYKNKSPEAPVFEENPEIIDYRNSYTFKWRSSDSEGDPIKYYVYFGDSANPPLALETETPEFTVENRRNGERLYLRVEARDNFEGANSTSLQFFTSNDAPEFIGKPNLSDQRAFFRVFWEAADPDGDSLFYTVEMSGDGADYRTVRASTDNYVDLTSLQQDKRYSIRIRADDQRGKAIDSEILIIDTPSAPYISDFILPEFDYYDPVFQETGYIANYYYPDVVVRINGEEKTLPVTAGHFSIEERLSAGKNTLEFLITTPVSSKSERYIVNFSAIRKKIDLSKGDSYWGSALECQNQNTVWEKVIFSPNPGCPDYRIFYKVAQEVSELSAKSWVSATNGTLIEGYRNYGKYFELKLEFSGALEGLVERSGKFDVGEIFVVFKEVEDTEAPIISIPSEIPGHSNTPSFGMQIEVLDNCQLSSIRINEELRKVDGGRDFSGVLYVELSEGPNHLVLTAVDWLGNSSSTTFDILLDTIPPLIERFTVIETVSWISTSVTAEFQISEENLKEVKVVGSFGERASEPNITNTYSILLPITGEENSFCLSLRDSSGNVTEYNFVVKKNFPPTIPTTEFRFEDLVNYLNPLQLTWVSEDPEGLSVSYRVYFGTQPFVSHVIETRMPLFRILDLKPDTIYYWQVEAIDEFGDISAGPMWEIRTSPERDIFKSPVSIEEKEDRLYFSWSCYPDIGEGLEYQVHFKNQETLEEYRTANPFFEKSQLLPGTDYEIEVRVYKLGRGIGSNRKTFRTKPSPSIIIHSESYPSGIVNDRKVTVRGSVSNYYHREISLSLNGVERRVPLSGSTFAYELILEVGENRITVAPISYLVIQPQELTLIFQKIDEPEYEDLVWIELTWNKNLADIDLHVLEPNGNRIYYNNMRGRGVLDRDDTDGYGPEHYTIERGFDASGEYDVYLDYFDPHGQQDPVECKLIIKRKGEIIGEHLIVLRTKKEHRLVDSFSL